MAIGTITDNNIGTIADSNIGKVGTYLKFNGISNTVQIPNKSVFNSPSEITLISVAKSYRLLKNSANTIDKRTYTQHRFGFGNSGETIGGSIHTSGGYNDIYTTSNLGQKYMGAISFKANDFISLFVDGIKVESYVPNDGNIVIQPDPVILGENVWAGYFNGNIYLTAIYNKAKSSDWIKQFYNDYSKNNDMSKYWQDPACVLYMDGDSIGDNGVWYDKSVYHNDGTIYGAKKISNVEGLS